MSNELQDQVASLQRSQRRVSYFALAAVVVAIVSLVRASRGPEPVQRIDLADGKYHSSLLASGLHVGPARLTPDGVFVMQPVGIEDHAYGSLLAGKYESRLGISHRERRFEVAISHGVPTIGVTFEGAVKSVLEVDTSTGAWTLARTRTVDGKPVSTRTVIVPGL